MLSYTAQRQQEEERKKEEKKIFNLQLRVAPHPAGFACTASIHSQWGNITQSTHTETEKQTRSIYTKYASEAGANRAAAALLFVSLLFSFSFPALLLSIHLPVFLPPYVICHGPISMSWRHLYSRQTQGGMC